MMKNPAWVTLYHGTRVDPQVLYSQGLRVPDFSKVIQAMDMLRIQRGMPEPPKWARKLAEQMVQSRSAHPKIHLTFARSQAASYAQGGGELFYEVAEHILWKGYGIGHYKFKNPEKYRIKSREIAQLVRGPNTWVVEVVIPFSWMDERAQRYWNYCVGEEEEDITQEWVEVTVSQDIPPQYIRSIKSAGSDPLHWEK